MDLIRCVAEYCDTSTAAILYQCSADLLRPIDNSLKTLVTVGTRLKFKSAACYQRAISLGVLEAIKVFLKIAPDLKYYRYSQFNFQPWFSYLYYCYSDHRHGYTLKQYHELLDQILHHNFQSEYFSLIALLPDWQSRQYLYKDPALFHESVVGSLAALNRIDELREYAKTHQSVIRRVHAGIDLLNDNEMELFKFFEEQNFQHVVHADDLSERGLLKRMLDKFHDLAEAHFIMSVIAHSQDIDIIETAMSLMLDPRCVKYKGADRLNILKKLASDLDEGYPLIYAMMQTGNIGLIEWYLNRQRAYDFYEEDTEVYVALESNVLDLSIIGWVLETYGTRVFSEWNTFSEIVGRVHSLDSGSAEALDWWAVELDCPPAKKHLDALTRVVVNSRWLYSESVLEWLWCWLHDWFSPCAGKLIEYALEKGNFDVLEWLKNKDVPLSCSSSALVRLLEIGSLDVLRLVDKQLTKLNSTSRLEGLRAIFKNGRVDVLDWLMKESSLASKLKIPTRELLYIAAENNQIAILRWCKDKIGNDPLLLILAVKSGNPGVVDWYKAEKAFDVSIEDKLVDLEGWEEVLKSYSKAGDAYYKELETLVQKEKEERKEDGAFWVVEKGYWGLLAWLEANGWLDRAERSDDLKELARVVRKCKGVAWKVRDETVPSARQ